MKRFVYVVLTALLIAFTLTSCNDKKDDPLYIDAMSFFCDEGDDNSIVMIDHKKQDVYFTVGEESLVMGVSYRIVKINDSGDMAYFDFLYDHTYGLDEYFEADGKIKIIETSSKYTYYIVRLQCYIGVRFYRVRKPADDFISVDTKDFPEIFGNVITRDCVEEIKVSYGQTIGLICYDRLIKNNSQSYFSEEEDDVSLNPNIKINCITRINPNTGNQLIRDTFYLNFTYLGDSDTFNLDDIAFTLRNV
jgi:hypothetical protein